MDVISLVIHHGKGIAANAGGISSIMIKQIHKAGKCLFFIANAIVIFVNFSVTGLLTL
jgi:hypothetical protein